MFVCLLVIKKGKETDLSLFLIMIGTHDYLEKETKGLSSSTSHFLRIMMLKDNTKKYWTYFFVLSLKRFPKKRGWRD